MKTGTDQLLAPSITVHLKQMGANSEKHTVEAVS